MHVPLHCDSCLVDQSMSRESTNRVSIEKQPSHTQCFAEKIVCSRFSNTSVKGFVAACIRTSGWLKLTTFFLVINIVYVHMIVIICYDWQI